MAENKALLGEQAQLHKPISPEAPSFRQGCRSREQWCEYPVREPVHEFMEPVSLDRVADPPVIRI